METVSDRAGLRNRVSGWKSAGERVALVPTMGNLHAGHLSLVRAALDLADRCVTSIFVNPTQFGAGEDFDTYPRTPEADLAMLEKAGCDLVFLPATEEIYPYGVQHATRLTAAPDLARRLEGRSRPGHFDGVVTVVARLFALVRPDVAVFGEKDYQQLLVIERMAGDLGFEIDIHAAATIRSADGLALSSRNSYLDAAQVEAANALNLVLADAAKSASGSGHDLGGLEKAAAAALEAAGLKVDYVAIRRARDLAPPRAGDRNLRVLAAVWCGQTRLIDNMPILPR